MKSSIVVAAITVLLSWGALAAPKTMKPHHADAMGGNMTCRTCHTAKGKFQRPSAETCIECHGGMSEIPIQANRWDKDPHGSHHYEDLLECTLCHSEHQSSRAICSDCHVVEFSNLK
ncbi:cytochrome c3 family protein [Ferrimonas sp. YFM]|uniref:cytochrome c3 family protein n=1 Tax=Ferrimonas sp. YFM TaxID=3028878 RepID=UPI002572C623|nr:cytochrome c3 family protein [Ferrimonas sp. YFM]BDY06086.1 flavocytochrome c heme submit [Ferrimonas sp. YFM]